MAALSLSHKRLTSLFGLKDVVHVPLVELDLRDNELTSFEHFGTHPELRVLHADDNAISSYLGMTKQKSLEQLFLQGNPVALQPYYRVMALLTIGFSLKAIDGKPVESSERELARKLGPSAALAVSYGWLLDASPRTTAEYDAIIVELRKARKLKLEQSAHAAATLRTVPMVVAEAQSESFEAKGLTPTMETVELQSKAILHFSKRVAQLEHQLRELQHLLATERDDRARRGDTTSAGARVGEEDSAALLSPFDLSVASSITFDGLQLCAPQSAQGVACLVVFHPKSLEVQKFFTRGVLVEIDYTDVVCCQVVLGALRVTLGSRQGPIFELGFPNESLMSVVHRLLIQRCRYCDWSAQPAPLPLALPPLSSSSSVAAPEATAAPTSPMNKSATVPEAENNVTEAPSSDAVRARPPQSAVRPAVTSSIESANRSGTVDIVAAPKVSAHSTDEGSGERSPTRATAKPHLREVVTHKDVASATGNRRDASSAAVPASATESSTAPPPARVSDESVARPVQPLGGSSSSVSSTSAISSFLAAAPVGPSASTAPPSAPTTRTAKAPPHRPPESRAQTAPVAHGAAVGDDDDDDSPGVLPSRTAPPRRVAWRGKEIRELLIESSDSD